MKGEEYVKRADKKLFAHYRHSYDKILQTSWLMHSNDLQILKR